MSKITKNPLQAIMDRATRKGIDKGPAIRDILTDVMHLCDQHGIHFQKIVEGASEVYKEEKGLYYGVSAMAGDNYKRSKKYS